MMKERHRGKRNNWEKNEGYDGVINTAKILCLPPVTGPHILMCVTETCHPHRKRENISPDYTPLTSSFLQVPSNALFPFHPLQLHHVLFLRKKEPY